MSFKFILIFASMMSVSAAALSQTVVDVSMRSARVEAVVEYLAEKTDYQFIYREGLFGDAVAGDIDVRGASVADVLDMILRPAGFDYQIVDNMVVIKCAPAAQPPSRITVTGRVLTTGGKPVVGATVAVPNSGIGTATDGDGTFTLSVPAATPSFEVRYLGMKTQSVPIGTRRTFEVVMAEDAAGIDEVVITGIFDKARESSVGAATTITREELKASGNRSILTAIRNVDPSFNIADNIEFGSDPNRLPDITMRGRTSMDVSVRNLQEETEAQSSANRPLFIVDGFEVSLQRVMDMDDQQVETVTLLKDASATALYGSRGANGIVVITTRRPEAGRIRFTYNGNLNIEAPDLTSYNLMNAREKLEFETIAGLYTPSSGNTLKQTMQELYGQRLADIERGVDTYWLKYPVRTGVGHRHSLRLEGGADNLRYAANLAYNNIVGTMKESIRNTFTGNVFLSYELKNVKFQNDLTLGFNKHRNSPYGTFSQYTTLNSYFKPYDDEGALQKMLYSKFASNDPQSAVGNPLWNAVLPSKDEGKYTNITNNFSIEWQILPELSLRGRFGITKQDDRTDSYLSKEHTSFESLTGDDYKYRGSYNFGTQYQLSWEADFTLNYNRTFNEVHQLYAGFNGSLAESRSERYSFAGRGYSAPNMDNIGMAAAYVEGSPVSYEEHSRRLGVILNLNYTYANRYFVDLSGKLEGSSKFGSQKRTAPFWSAGVGWNIHNEKFFDAVTAVNSLRLRFSYGTTGSQNFNAYQALTTFRYYQNNNYKYWNGAYMMAMGNPDLGWEKTRQMNAGIETRLWDNRLTLSVDFYNKLTEALLTDINIPSASGFESYRANMGEVRNRGVEANLNLFVIRNRQSDITWSVGGSIVHNTNKIMKISNSLEYLNQILLADEFNPSFIYREGQSMNTIFAVRSLGIDPANGQEIYLDRAGNRTYVYNVADKMPCGINEPKVWGNLRTMFRWKGLTLNAIFGYRLGGYVYNSTLVSKVENVSPWSNLDRRALYDRWKSPGDRAAFRAIRDYYKSTNATSRFVMKENTIELRSLNIEYEIPAQWLTRRIGLEYLAVGFSTEDVFRISTIRQERGTAYPFARKFSLSLTARF